MWTGTGWLSGRARQICGSLLLGWNVAGHIRIRVHEVRLTLNLMPSSHLPYINLASLPFFSLFTMIPTCRGIARPRDLRVISKSTGGGLADKSFSLHTYVVHCVCSLGSR